MEPLKQNAVLYCITPPNSRELGAKPPDHDLMQALIKIFNIAKHIGQLTSFANPLASLSMQYC